MNINLNSNMDSVHSSENALFTTAIPEDLAARGDVSQHQAILALDSHQCTYEAQNSLMNVRRRPVCEVSLENRIVTNPSEGRSMRKIVSQLHPIDNKDECFKKIRTAITKFFPFIKIFSSYQWKEWILLDLVSGLSVGMFIIPQAIAFSLLANLAPHYGFYSAFFAMIIYFFFGTSKHLNLSSQGVVSLLVGKTVMETYGKICGVYSSNRNSSSLNLKEFISPEPHNISEMFCGEDIDVAKIGISVALTLFVGVFQIIMGIFRLGWVTIYLSDPLVSAFTCGAGFHVVMSQFQHILGTSPIISTGMFNFPKNLIANFQAIPFKSHLRHQRGINWNAFIISLVSLIILIIVKKINEKYIKKIKVPIPIDIIVLIIGLVLSKFLNWENNLGITIVGNITNGFETPHLPRTFLIKYIISDAFVLAIISYAIGISLAKSFAIKHGYQLDPDQEFMAYGITNFLMSFFNTFVAGSSLVCSSLHESLNGKTQIYSIFASFITLIGILSVATYFSDVPKAVVGAIIIMNLKGMVLKVLEVPSLWRINKYDFFIWLVTFSAVILLDLAIGLGIGIVFSLATVIYRTQISAAYIMGRIPDTDIYRNIKKHNVEEIVSIKIFKFEGNIYFASAENFRRSLYKCTGVNPKKLLERIKRGKPLIKSNEILTPSSSNTRNYVNFNDQAEDGAYVEIKNNNGLSSEKVKPQQGGSSKNVLNFSYIVLDLSACSFVDSVGIRVLSSIVEDYRSLGVQVFFACVVRNCKELLRKAGFYNKNKEEYIFVSVHDAVLAAHEDSLKCGKNDAESSLCANILSKESNLVKIDEDADNKFNLNK